MWNFGSVCFQYAEPRVIIAEGKSGANEPSIFSSVQCLLAAPGRNSGAGWVTVYQTDCDWLFASLKGNPWRRYLFQKLVFCLGGQLFKGYHVCTIGGFRYESWTFPLAPLTSFFAYCSCGSWPRTDIMTGIFDETNLGSGGGVMWTEMPVIIETGHEYNIMFPCLVKWSN